MKIAVCLYGQPRAWRHTEKWIRAQYGEVDYFCSVKNYNKEKFLEEGELDELLDTFKPRRSRIESFGQFEGYGPSHYLLKSMYSSLQLKQQYELATGTQYDLVFLQRYDLATGPELNWLDHFKNNDFLRNQLFVGKEDEFFSHMGFRFGMSDWIIAGSDAAMSLFMTGLVNAFNPGRYGSKTADSHLYTSHIILSQICASHNLNVRVDLSLNSAIVREESVNGWEPSIDFITANWERFRR